MDNISELSKSDLARKLDNARAVARRFRQETERATRVGTNAVVVAAGGCAAGVLAQKFPFIPNTQVPTDLVVGTACVVGAMLDAGGAENDKLAAFGAGLLAAAAARETQKALVKQG